MRANLVTISDVAKKQPGPTLQLNVRLEVALVEGLDKALSQQVPDITTASFMRMVIRAFLLDNDAFLKLIREFLEEHG